MKTKRILAIVLSLALCLSLLPGTALAAAPDGAADDVTGMTLGEGVHVHVDEDGTVHIHADSHADDHADEPVEQPAEGSADQPADEPADQPADGPADQPAEGSADQPADEAADGSLRLAAGDGAKGGAKGVAVSLDGAGTETNPYLIYDAEDLFEFADLVNGTGAYAGNEQRDACAKLMESIDLGGADWTPIGHSPSSSTYYYYEDVYTGVFNGQGKSITGLKVSLSGIANSASAGLFGVIGSGGYVHDLSVSGALSAYNTMETNAGGIAGMSRGTIECCAFTGDVNAETQDVERDDRVSAGGIVGDNRGTVENCCYRSGTISTSGMGHQYVGGIVGINRSAVTGCLSFGVINGGDTTEEGGVVGGCSGSVSNSYYDVTVADVEDGYGHGATYSGSSFTNVAGLTTAKMTGANALTNMPGLVDTVWVAREGDYPIQQVFYTPPVTLDVAYVDAQGADMGTEACIVVESDVTAWTDGWYAVTQSVTVNTRITVSGDVNLILCDGCTLTASMGVNVAAGNSLTVWAQSDGAAMGALTATNHEEDAGIGGGDQQSCGTVMINGGSVYAAGGTGSAGIGGGYGYSWHLGKAGDSVMGAGDGGNATRGATNGGNVTIRGGVVIASSGGGGAEAIGHGNNGGSSGDLDVPGMRVYASEDGDPVPALQREDACRGEWVMLTVCDPHSYENGVCAYCGACIPTPYIDPTDESEPNKTCDAYTALTDQTALTSGWYVVNSDVEISQRITVSGTVNLLLCDGCTLTASGGVNVSEGNSLTIWAQSDATEEGSSAGALFAGTTDGTDKTCGDYFAGIGGGQNENGGTVNIYGGTVTAAGGQWGGAGVGGGYNGDGGTITVNGAAVNASGGAWGAGIGGGDQGDGGTITIVGSDLTATGGDGGAGIGGGYGSNRTGGDGGTITITDSAVTASGGENGAGIGGGSGGDGGDVTISGGTVTAIGGNGGAGIGGGYSQNRGGDGGTITITDCELTATSGLSGAGIGGGYKGDGGTITITGGTVIASGGDQGAGVGGGYGYGGKGGSGVKITITDCDLTATGGMDAAGIGGGQYGNGGEITITGGTVIATGVGCGAGIGGGLGNNGGGDSGSITITDCELTATSGGAAGIGGGMNGNGETITITGGTVTATGGTNGAGIGGGHGYNKGGDGGTITITDCELTATGGDSAAGIGGGYYGDGGTTTINGGTVIACGGPGGAGIGGGYQGAGGDVTISGGTVTAIAGSGGAEAIGRGVDGTSSGSVTIADGLHVRAGGDEASAQDSLAEERENACRSGWVKLSPCTAHEYENRVCKWCEAVLLEDVAYVDPTDPDEPNKTAACVLLTNNEGTLALTGGWYAVDGDVTIGNETGGFERIEISGDVHIILADGCTLSTGGVKAAPGGSLTIWGQTEGSGTLIADGRHTFTPGIECTDASVTINGGTVDATGNVYTAGIGGTFDEYGGSSFNLGGPAPFPGGTVTVNGGTVNATGGEGAAGIGGSLLGAGGPVTITGGTVVARAGDHSDWYNDQATAQAIGRGQGSADSGDLIIPGMKAYASEDAADPVPALQRKNACRGGWVKLEVCDPHSYYYTGVCEYCGALGPVPYLDPTDAAEPEKTCDTYTVLTDQTALDSGWYVVNADAAIPERVTVSGDVNLILCDGVTLTVPRGVTVEGDNSLTVWAQSDAEEAGSSAGRLFAGTTDGTDSTCESDRAGIGSDQAAAGKLTVNGGFVTAVGCYQTRGAGLGGNRFHPCSLITINGGVVSAKGGQWAAGIGNGPDNTAADGGSIVITGGTVTATATYRAAGIGGGMNGTAPDVLITGGTVSATGSSSNGSCPGIGGGTNRTSGSVTITGGTVTAIPGSGAQAIGSAVGWSGEPGPLTITGMRVTDPAGTLAGGREAACRASAAVTLTVCAAHEVENGACKWCGATFSPIPYLDPTDAAEPEKTCDTYTVIIDQTGLTNGWYVVTSDVEISGRITVNGDVKLILVDGFTLNAVKGVNVSGGNSLTIYGQSGDGGTLTVFGDGGAGIGGNTYADCGSITINGGTINASVDGSGSGSRGAAIGGGRSRDNGVITINGGIVTARAYGTSSAIGGGGAQNAGRPAGAGGTILITGGTVTAIATLGAAIGGGGATTVNTNGGAPGSITITGGTVTASASEGAAIGSGRGNTVAGGSITITGGTVTAECSNRSSQAIGHGKDSDDSVSLRIDGMKVYASDGGDPVPAAQRESTCRGIWAKLEPCDPHSYDEQRGVCEYCGESGGPVAYVDPTDPAEPNKTAVCVPLTDDGTDRLDLTEGWYALIENVDGIFTFTVTGSVNLILCDGCTLNDTGGIIVNPGSSLTIWGQTEGSGTLSADGVSNHEPGIQNTDASVTINGGTVIATGAEQCAGIGGLYEYDVHETIESCGTVTVNGGTVVATGGSGAAGIGSGEKGDYSQITITGGTVTAIAGSYAQAIGRGSGIGSSGVLIIDGMKVTDPAGTLAGGRIDACRGERVTLEVCDPHENENGACKWCGAVFPPVPYLDPTDEAEPDKTCNTYTVLTDRTELTNGWYVLNADTAISERVTVTGEVNLILTDGATLTVPKGVNVSEGNSLTVYGQTNQTGALFAGTTDGTDKTCGYYNAGIGGGRSASGGTITINGGTINATGGIFGAGIGGGDEGAGGEITVNGGTVNATGGAPENKYSGAGIGGGSWGSGGSVTISGGTVTAVAGNANAQAIGRGDEYNYYALSEGSLTLYDEAVVLTGEDYQTVVTGDGRENACRGERAKIVSGDSGVSYLDPTDESEPNKTCYIYTVLTDQTALTSGWYVVNSDVEITERITISGNADLILCDGLTLTATKGITVGEGSSLTIWAQNGGTGALFAGTTDGTDTTCTDYCAGIGGGDFSAGGEITIRGGKVTAFGNGGGAGIGGGDGGAGGTITISGGTVCAIGSDGAGIGGGWEGAGGTITISGGTVIAYDRYTNSQAIGGGNGSDADSLTIDGMKAYVVEGGDPVPAAERETACRGNWVKLEVCDPHSYDNNTGACEYCGTAGCLVTLTAAPSAGGTVNGGGIYDAGASVTVTATANPGYEFDGWEEGGAVVSTDASYTFTVTGSRTLTASFSRSYYFITVKGGTTDHATAVPGDTITITANPATGETAFVQWPQIEGVRYAKPNALTTTFSMPAKDLTIEPVYAAILIWDIDDQVYTGEEIRPTVHVELDGVDAAFQENTDYAITYANNTDAGRATLTVTFMDRYTRQPDPNMGVKSKDFTILAADISAATVTADDQTYAGAALTPDVTVTWNGKTLTTEDYTLSWSDNVNVGRATVTVTGKGNFTGTASGHFTINKAPLTITADSDTKVYDGTALRKNSYTSTGLVGNHRIASVTVTGSQTEAGSSANVPSAAIIKDANDVDVTNNYAITYVNGTLTVEPLSGVVVTITGHNDVASFDNKAHSVSGYDVSISDPLYTEADFTFSGEAKAERTDVGTTYMGLNPKQFENINGNFTGVTFAVTDGYQTIAGANEVVVTITGCHDTAIYDGKEHVVSGYDVQISDPLYLESYFTFTGTDVARRTDAGTTTMGLTENQFKNTNRNFDNVTFVVTDGYQTITALSGVTVTITGRSDTVTYDGTEHVVSGYDVEISEPLYTAACFTFKGTAEARRTDAGEASMGLAAEQFENTSENFTGVTFAVTDGTLTVTPKALTITAASDTKVYDGAALTNAGYANTALAAGERIESVAVTGSQTLVGESANIPSAAVIRNAAGDDVTANYGITYESGTLEVTPKALTITAASDTKVYDGTPLEKDSYSNTELAAGDSIESVTVTGSRTSAGESANVPSAAVIRNAAGVDVTGCYSITYANGTLKVTRRALTITAASDTKVYDSTPLVNPGYQVSGLAEGDHVESVTVTGSQTVVGSNANVPSAAVVKNEKGEDVTANYAITYVNGTLTVTNNPALIITAASGSKVYDGTPLVNDGYQVSGLAAGDHVERVTVTGSRTIVGTSENTPSAAVVKNAAGEDVTDNYAITYVNGTLEVTPKALTVTAASDTKVYDGTALTNAGYTNTEPAAGDGIERVAVTGSRTDVGTSDNVPSAAVIRNAAGDDVTGCYSITYANGTLEVTPKALTVTAASDTKEYDGTPLVNDGYQVSGLAEGDSMDSVTVTGSQTTVGTSANVPSAAVVKNAAGKDVTANYSIKYVNGSLTVTSNRSLIITANSASKVYDGTPLADGGWQVTGLAAGDTVESVTVTGSQTDVGTSANVPSAAVIRNAKGEDVTDNYEITYESGTLEVTPKALTVTAASDSKVYDGAPLEKNSYSNTELAAGDTIDSVTVTGSRTDVGTSANVPSAAVIRNAAGDDVTGCYEITYANGTLTVTPAGVTLTAASGTATYDGTEKTVTGYTASVAGLTFENVTASGSGTNAGDYAVTFTGVTVNETTDSSGNYLVTGTTNGTLTITPKAVTVTAKDQSVQLGGTIAVGPEQATLSGAADGHRLTAVTLTASSTDSATDSGTITPSGAAISDAQGADVTANYVISYADGVLTVTGHVWGDWIVTTPPSCTEPGEETRTCADCGETETRPVAALGHDLIHHDAQAPTCTEPGWEAYDTCSRCDYTTYVEIPALGHDFGDWVTVTEPTENSPGLERRVCDRCGAAMNRTIAQLSHECPSKHFTDVDLSQWYHEDLDYVVANGLMVGVSDTEFAPNQPITRAMVVTAIWRLEGEPDAPKSPFTDVAEDSWYASAVNWAAQEHITKGMSETLFAPDLPVTREMLATFFFRYAQYKGFDTTATASLQQYRDADKVSDWALEAVIWAKEMQIVNGIADDLLAPTDKATRIQFAAMLHRYCVNILGGLS